MLTVKYPFVYSDEGKYVRNKRTNLYSKRQPCFKVDDIDDFEEVDEAPKFTREEYKTKVNELIKEKYSLEDENAIRRKAFNTILNPSLLSEEKAETAMNEYYELNNFIEECKTKAVELLNTNNHGQEI